MTPFFQGFPGPVDPNEEAEAKRVPVSLELPCICTQRTFVPLHESAAAKTHWGLRIGFPCRDYFSFTGEAPGGFLLLILSHLETTIMQKTFFILKLKFISLDAQAFR